MCSQLLWVLLVDYVCMLFILVSLRVIGVRAASSLQSLDSNLQHSYISFHRIPRVISIINISKFIKNSPFSLNITKIYIIALLLLFYANCILYTITNCNTKCLKFDTCFSPSHLPYTTFCSFPQRAIPVDLFPHTPHFELVILFERWDKEKWTRIMEGMYHLT